MCIPFNCISFDIGYKNMAYCVMKIYDRNSFVILEYGVLNILKQKTFNIYKIKNNLKILLDTLNNKYIVTNIVIEDQIKARMKIIQHFVYDYFFLLTNYKITCISPRHKNTYKFDRMNNTEYNNIYNKLKIKTSKKHTVCLLIYYCNVICNEYHPFVNIMKSRFELPQTIKKETKKLDDISDCIFQALSFFMSQ